MNVHRVMPLVVGPSVAFGADPGSLPTLARWNVGVAGVDGAPAQVVLQPARQRRMVRMIRGAHRERAQR